MTWAARIFGSSNQQITKKYSLDPDTFSMMILSNPYRTSTCCKGCICFSLTPEWILGISVFCMQCLLGLMIAWDQLHGDGDNYTSWFNVPLSVTSFVAFGQLFTIILALMTQTDILMAVKTLHYLRHKDDNFWEEMIAIDDGKINRTLITWFIRVFIPLFMKLTEGCLILFITWVLIVQSDNIVDLLKDFTALFVISSVDDLFFVMGSNGYLGKAIHARSQDVITAELRTTFETNGSSNRDSVIYKAEKDWMQTILVAIIFLTLFGGWMYIAVHQASGLYVENKYPFCKDSTNLTVSIWFSGIGDGTCNENYDLKECGMDGGDCFR